MEDLKAEELLVAEAIDSGIAVDAKRVRELARKAGLTAEETEYLKRYLLISGLSVKRFEGLPEERVAETLTISYSEKDKLDKAVVATDVQIHARNGMPFDEISRKYPEKAVFSLLSPHETEVLLKERGGTLLSKGAQEGEAVILWSPKTYVLVKLQGRKVQYKPFEEMKPAEFERVRDAFGRWIQELNARKGPRSSQN